MIALVLFISSFTSRFRCRVDFPGGSEGKSICLQCKYGSKYANKEANMYYILIMGSMIVLIWCLYVPDSVFLSISIYHLYIYIYKYIYLCCYILYIICIYIWIIYFHLIFFIPTGKYYCYFNFLNEKKLRHIDIKIPTWSCTVNARTKVIKSGNLVAKPRPLTSNLYCLFLD